MHTDWIDFIAHTTNLNQHERDRVRRLMRALYSRFDGVFVLNREHRDWLTGHEMQLPEDKVFLTAHHTALRDLQVQPARKSELIPGANDKTPVLFIACRLSREKGIFDLPEIVQEARLSLPNLQIVVAGSGPASEDLQRALPDAVFLGWQTREQLASLYLGLDLFVFPSRFDTFGNVLLEAFTHGMPAVAYNCKGPKDILEHGVSGYLTEDVSTMAEAVVDFFSGSTNRNVMAENARKRAARFQAEPIMRKFLEDLGLDYPEQVHAEVTVA